MKDYKNQIEAILFASGRYIDADTLMNLVGASNKQVLINNIKKIKEDYEKRNSPLMIVQEKNGWKLTVRETYLPLVRKIVSETELQKSVLETLAVIAWKSPVLQSEVVNIRHNKAYDHIAELIELGFIKKEPSGRSYLLTLTEKFYEYFDVEGTKDIRKVFSRIVGEPEGVQALQEEALEEDLEQTQDYESEESAEEDSEEEFGELEESPVEEEFEELDSELESSEEDKPENIKE